MDDSRCPRCGLNTIETDVFHKHKVEGNRRVHEIGDYIHDRCTFCGWESEITWTKGGWKRQGSPPISPAQAQKLRLRVAKHKKLLAKTTTRKRERK